MADSDWFLLGTSIPFWVMAGTLVAVTCSSGKSIKLNSIHSCSVYVLSALCLVFSIQFAVGDYRANVDTSSNRFEAAVEVSPWNPVYQRAYALNGASSSEDALDAASKAVSLAPKDGANYFCRGLIYLTLREPDKAIPELEKSLELNPHSTQVMKMLSDIYQQVGNQASAENVLQRMLDQENLPNETIKGIPDLVDTNYAYAHAYFGRKLQASGKYRAALEHFQKAVDRLERWKNSGQFLEIARASGTLTAEEEQRKLELLKECSDNMKLCNAKLEKR
jgi:tetratricopeptide (TPR) repeat protein